ncbi:hypothetical protein NONO_c23320 [Nocardia nova SH22a]|uniref:Peptidase MA superfamily protein n=1 Tax=Nocardia nova SH22a TaxID=1415166 RepID=W5TDQ0_9NOCA|nr:hypothetical protein [Nocardia nova]AHH17128.1 hypothetical protein NONO_c23320 [Nocardia nova SH22a]
MSALPRVREWLAHRGRFEFVVTVALVIALTAAVGALLLLPRTGLHTIPAAAPAAGAPAAHADPQVPDLRRIMSSYGPVVAQQVSGEDGRLSVVLGHPYQRGDIDQLAREVEPAVTAVSQVWGPDWAQEAVVTVASSTSEFAALTHAAGPVSGEVAAASVADPFVPGTRPTGQHIVFAADAGHRLGTDGLRETLRHELTHIAARAATVDGSPQWVLEGFAEYCGHRGDHDSFTRVAPTVTSRARAGQLPAALPADGAFVPAPGNDAALAYEQAWSANAFVADRFGEADLVALYRRLATGPQDDAALDRGLRDTLGIGRTEFVTTWQEWIKARVAA